MGNGGQYSAALQPKMAQSTMTRGVTLIKPPQRSNDKHDSIRHVWSSAFHIETSNNYVKRLRRLERVQNRVRLQILEARTVDQTECW